MAVQEQLKGAKVLALTADGWKGRRMESYLGITAHWINDKFEMCSCTLGVVHISGPHTGERISKMIKSVVTEFVDESIEISALVSDNGADMIKAGEKLSEVLVDFITHPCFAHTLQLAVNDVIGKGHYIKDINLVRQIVIAIRKSGTLSEEIQDRLILDEPTRWDSTFMMIRSFLDHNVEIKTCFENHRYEKYFAYLTFPNVTALTAMAEVLALFHEITKKASAEKYPSISKLPRYVHYLMKSLEDDEEEIDSVRKLKNELLQAVKARLGYILTEECIPLRAAPCENVLFRKNKFLIRSYLIFEQISEQFF